MPKMKNWSQINHEEHRWQAVQVSTRLQIPTRSLAPRVPLCTSQDPRAGVISLKERSPPRQEVSNGYVLTAPSTLIVTLPGGCAKTSEESINSRETVLDVAAHVGHP